jgi:site-specific recombinase XerD
VREFLRVRFPAGTIDIEKLTVQDLRQFIAARAARGQMREAQAGASALRAFLRYLVLQGMCADKLVSAVPTVVHRAARLPRHLTDDQVRKLLAAFDRSQPVGLRDRAIALCLARLGLRVGEVVGLRLSDIDWRNGILRLGNGKSRRTASLPLPREVGQAIAQYIRDARPAGAGRHVFVTHVVPLGRPLSATAASAAIRRAFTRADLDVPSKGPHVLRHTVATRMVREGASLKEVADVLRHRSLDTTTMYARVDLPALRSVAMPWPEVR